MGQDAIDIYNAQREYQLDEGNFSQVGIIDGVLEVNGIFDHHYYNAQKDGTGTPIMTNRKKFLVKSLPSFTEKSSKIVIDSVEYVIMKGDVDVMGVAVLWLK